MAESDHWSINSLIEDENNSGLKQAASEYLTSLQRLAVTSSRLYKLFQKESAPAEITDSDQFTVKKCEKLLSNLR